MITPGVQIDKDIAEAKKSVGESYRSGQMSQQDAQEELESIKERLQRAKQVSKSAWNKSLEEVEELLEEMSKDFELYSHSNEHSFAEQFNRLNLLAGTIYGLELTLAYRRACSSKSYVEA
jgi:hypothetical protein